MTQPIIILSLCLALVSLGFGLWSAYKIIRLSRAQKVFFSGKTGKDLEEALMQLVQRTTSLEDEMLAASGEIKKLENNLGFAIQKMGLVRYSPFADGGGNYSFSLALLNQHGSGIVITNMYGRQQSRVYTKTIYQGKSETPLTEEEQQAVRLSNEKN